MWYAVTMTTTNQKYQHGETAIDSERRNFILTAGANILINAYEGGYTGVAMWAISNGTYKWSDEGDFETASVTLYELDDDLDIDQTLLTKPLYIDETIIADFIIKNFRLYVNTELFNDSTMRELVAIAWGRDYDLDSYDSNAIVQAILLGEVKYG